MSKASNSKSYCFCTLAFRKEYRNFAKQLAKDLESFSPGTQLFVATDNPKDFKDSPNVTSLKCVQENPLFPYNDKLQAIKMAIANFQTVIFVDADSRMTDYFNEDINWSPGMVVYCDLDRSLAKSLKDYYPERDYELFQKLSEKLGIKRSLDTISFPMQSLYVISRENGKEQQFIENWNLISKYLAVHRCATTSDGYTMALAMASVGWEPKMMEEFHSLNRVIKHIGNREGQVGRFNVLEKIEFRLSYYYRLLIIYLKALKSFGFFFG